MASFGVRRTGEGRRVSRPLLGAYVLFAITLGWFVAFGIRPVGPPALLWATNWLFPPLAAAVFWRTGRDLLLPEASRRCWRHLAAAALLIGVGQVGQTYHFVTHPGAPGAYISHVMVVADGVGLLILIYALLRLPVGLQTLGEVLRVVLDALTVIVGAAVFIWHFGTRQAVAGGDSGPVASLALVVLALLGLFVLVKVLLSDVVVIDRGGMQLLALAIFVGALAPMLQPWITMADPRMSMMQISVPLACVLAAAAAERQRNVRLAPRDRRRRRAFSVLPYLAVAAVDGLLLWSAFVDRSDLAAVTVAAVLLTGLVVVRQVTALRDNGHLLQKLDHGANYDALTGLPNRVLFRRRLDAALGHGDDRPVAVALIDLDNFKQVNDTLGHEVGDRLLVEVARRLATSVRAGDTVARLGGDEFVVVLDGVDPTGADEVAQGILDALAAPVSLGGHELSTHASIGVADGSAGDDASSLLRHADIAMYSAKRRGGTRFAHYAAGMEAGARDVGGVVGELRQALAESQLFLVFQPIVSLQDRRMLGVEALVRWAHPQRGVLAPQEFIPVAENAGLAAQLDRWVIRAALSSMAEWDAVHGAAAPDRININVSAATVRDPALPDDVAEALASSGVPAARVTIEVTETVVLEQGAAVATLRRLRALGLRISLDDFGTEYSTLSMLHSCPVDELKLDRSFTQAEPTVEVSMAAVVLHLAQVLRLDTVAEGTETPEQAARLVSLGYRAAQGYLFARPLPFADLSRLLGDGRAAFLGDSAADRPDVVSTPHVLAV